MNWIEKIFRRSAPAPAQVVEGRVAKRPAARQKLPYIAVEGEPRLGAAGESHYQGALSEICGGHSRHGHSLACEAELIPDPSNAYDPNAVEVRVSGILVGFLPRAAAVRFHRQMAIAGHEGSGGRCAALIVGGWRTNQHDEGHFGIKLGIPGRGPFNIV